MSTIFPLFTGSSPGVDKVHPESFKAFPVHGKRARLDIYKKTGAAPPRYTETAAAFVDLTPAHSAAYITAPQRPNRGPHHTRRIMALPHHRSALCVRAHKNTSKMARLACPDVMQGTLRFVPCKVARWTLEHARQLDEHPPTQGAHAPVRGTATSSSSPLHARA
ncbi:hypothetical protein CGC20_18250 [Leishmania donovani]|uniref:Uncharacterized protein n=1 Tax=Leishmania donovani TaxID=5661 RepID=A0A504XVQ1_LEIDO|nr:hypothetical protein CGC20_18250 [Leishmania donovani]